MPPTLFIKLLATDYPVLSLSLCLSPLADRTAVPGMNEMHVDIKKHLDETLKASCQSLKYSAVQYLLGPLEGFLAKVTAFLGEAPPLVFSSVSSPMLGSDIPVYRGGGISGGGGGSHENLDDHAGASNLTGEEATIPSHLRDNLKKQQFVKVDRVHSLLTSVLQTCLEAKPQFAAMVKVSPPLSLSHLPLPCPSLSSRSMSITPSPER
jgi:hypothetical protein